MGSKVGDMTFAPGRNVCLESLSALTAAWVDSRSKVPVPWCHGTAIVPAVRREDEKERHDQRGQDPLAMQGPGMRVEQDARLWHGRARRARVHRLAPVGGHPRATACERPHAAPAQRAWLEPVAAMPDGRAGPRRGAPRRHPPGPQSGRAHRLGRRARTRLVRGPARDQRRMDEPDGPHRSNPWPSYATGRRHPQGPQARMAARPRATPPVAHLPRHRRHTRHEPAPRGVPAAAAPGQGTHACQGRRRHGRLAGRLQRMGDAAQGLPRAEKHLVRRQRERPAPTTRQGARHHAPSHTRAHHVHLHGPGLGIGTPVPTTNNAIESANARIREIPGNHRGLCLIRRIKAVCWWCHQHTEHPESAAWLARHAWRDEQIEQLYRQAWEYSDEGI